MQTLEHSVLKSIEVGLRPLVENQRMEKEREKGASVECLLPQHSCKVNVEIQMHLLLERGVWEHSFRCFLKYPNSTVQVLLKYTESTVPIWDRSSKHQWDEAA